MGLTGVNAVAEHYERLLAPVYSWMAGGAEAAMAAAASELEALHLPASTGDLVVDLGAGFGAHAIALGRRGARVVAIDSSRTLMRELVSHAAGLPVQAVVDDLTTFTRRIEERPMAVMCMGDTLTHLASVEVVAQLFADAAAVLPAGGRFVTSFRDYALERVGDERFIPVRSDADRILTCFLDYEPDHVVVHDLLHARRDDSWTLSAGRYRKLRLAPQAVAAMLEDAGFRVRREEGIAGMVRLVGVRH
jgi:SAM-dependent methyltransferase